MSKSGLLAITALTATLMGASAFAQAPGADAEIGKTYEITVPAEVESPFVGQFGDVHIGKIAVQIPGGKKGEKYSVTITAIAPNPFTGLQQASCTYKQVGGDREGKCNSPPAG